MSSVKINVNCIYNSDGAWCTNPKVKKSLFGLGARVCVKYPNLSKECDHCEKRKHVRPLPPTPMNVKKEK